MESLSYILILIVLVSFYNMYGDSFRNSVYHVINYIWCVTEKPLERCWMGAYSSIQHTFAKPYPTSLNYQWRQTSYFTKAIYSMGGISNMMYDLE